MHYYLFISRVRTIKQQIHEIEIFTPCEPHSTLSHWQNQSSAWLWRNEQIRYPTNPENENDSSEKPLSTNLHLNSTESLPKLTKELNSFQPRVDSFQRERWAEQPLFEKTFARRGLCMGRYQTCEVKRKGKHYQKAFL